MDTRSDAPRTIGAGQCGGVVRVDGVRVVGGDWNFTSGEDDPDRVAENILQIAMAGAGGVSIVVDGEAGGIASGRNHL